MNNFDYIDYLKNNILLNEIKVNNPNNIIYQKLTSPTNLEDTLQIMGYNWAEYSDLKGYIEQLTKENKWEWEDISDVLDRIQEEYGEKIAQYEDESRQEMDDEIQDDED